MSARRRNTSKITKASIIHIRKTAHWRPGGYIRSSGVLLGWLLLRATAQALMVLVLTRLLGAIGYGRFVSVIAVATIATPFAGLGLAHVMLRDGARSPNDIDLMLRYALRVWRPSALTCSLVAIGVAWFWLPRDLPWLAIPLVIAAEVVTASLTELFARVEQARNRISRFGAINAGLHIARLAILIPYAMMGTATLGGWLWLYALSSLGYATILYWGLRVHRTHEDVSTQLHISHGVPFATASLSMRLQAEFNKPVLAQQGFALAGNFAAAQRITDIASLPLLAMQDALWPRIFGTQQTRSQIRLITAALTLLALLSGALIWLSAPILPWLIGTDFVPAIETLRWMAWLPVCQLWRNLANFSSIQAGRTRQMGRAYIVVGLVSVAGFAWAVPQYGLAGAVGVAYLAELFMVVLQAPLLNLARARKHRG